MRRRRVNEKIGLNHRDTEGTEKKETFCVLSVLGVSVVQTLILIHTADGFAAPASSPVPRRERGRSGMTLVSPNRTPAATAIAPVRARFTGLLLFRC